jgi:hypothetical protein
MSSEEMGGTQDKTILFTILAGRMKNCQPHDYEQR